MFLHMFKQTNLSRIWHEIFLKEKGCRMLHAQIIMFINYVQKGFQFKEEKK